MRGLTLDFPPSKGAYLVGGTVRDLILGRTPVDYDIAVRENPAKFARRVAARHHGRTVPLGKTGHPMIRVVSKHHQFDIVPLAAATIDADLKQRDFTINAMACSLSSGRLCDPFGGARDLDEKKIRLVSDGAFRQDPVRLLRAFRLSAGLQFEIEPRTLSIVARDAPLITGSPGERIRDELLPLLAAAGSFKYIGQMAETGLLFSLIPEMNALKTCTQNHHHCDDVYHHTIKAYSYLETVLNDIDSYFPGLMQYHTAVGPEHAFRLLKWAILLHDIGKPSTRSVDAKGQIHFFGHARASAEAARRISQRFRFANREIRLVDSIIRSHMRPLSLFGHRHRDRFKTRILARFFLRCKGLTPYLLLGALADLNAKDHDGPNHALEDFLRQTWQDFFAAFTRFQKKPPLITGADLIDEFGLTPSPVFKKILNRVEESRLSGQTETRAAALGRVQAMLPELGLAPASPSKAPD